MDQNINLHWPKTTTNEKKFRPARPLRALAPGYLIHPDAWFVVAYILHGSWLPTS